MFNSIKYLSESRGASSRMVYAFESFEPTPVKSPLEDIFDTIDASTEGKIERADVIKELSRVGFTEISDAGDNKFNFKDGYLPVSLTITGAKTFEFSVLKQNGQPLLTWDGMRQRAENQMPQIADRIKRELDDYRSGIQNYLKRDITITDKELNGDKANDRVFVFSHRGKNTSLTIDKVGVIKTVRVRREGTDDIFYGSGADLAQAVESALAKVDEQKK